MKLASVDRRVNLGELAEAVAVSEFNQLVASAGESSAAAVLHRFRESLIAAVAAVQQGMANYQEVEAATEQRQRQLAEGGVPPLQAAPRSGQIMA